MFPLVTFAKRYGHDGEQSCRPPLDLPALFIFDGRGKANMPREITLQPLNAKLLREMIESEYVVPRSSRPKR